MVTFITIFFFQVLDLAAAGAVGYVLVNALGITRESVKRQPTRVLAIATGIGLLAAVFVSSFFYGFTRLPYWLVDGLAYSAAVAGTLLAINSLGDSEAPTSE